MKKIKILTITLAIVLIAMISFLGIYVQVQNRMEDTVKNYEYAMDISGTRVIRLKASTENKTVIKDSEGKEVTDASELTDEELQEKGYKKEEVPYNSEDVLNLENYKKSKDIMENRLNSLNINNYIAKLDENSGDIIVELPDNNNTDTIVTDITGVGNFEIIDSETKEVLMNNSDIKLSSVLYGNNSTSTSSGTSVYLNIEFTKDGAKKLEEISSKYVKTTNEQTDTNTTEDTESTENTDNATDTTTTEKKVTMKIDDQDLLSTSFDEVLKTGKIQLTIGSASTDKSKINNYATQASSIATLLDKGNLPIKYDVSENEFILSDITDNELRNIEYIIIAIVIISLIVLIVRYKSSGVMGAISFIGLASLFVLIIRYTNVILSIDGIFAIGLTLILNYIFTNKLLLKLKKIEKNNVDKHEVNTAVKETYKEFFIKIMPICISVIVFCFISWVPISSFGMVMFWGITLIALYNFIITNNLLKIKAEK